MFKQKVVWITGASSGIGEALALEFAKSGSNIILSSRRKPILEQVKQKCLELNDQIDVLVLDFDITDEKILEDKTRQANAFKGRIDMLINNAGISQRSPFLKTQMSTFRQLFELDLFAQIALTKQVLPIMIEQGEGHIAATASVAGKIGVPFRTGYCAVKHALMGFFDSLRSEVTQYNIKVTTITPGFIRTPISENALSGDGTAFGKQDASISGGMNVQDCAKVIMQGFKKGKPEIAVGKGLEMKILTLSRYFPQKVFQLMAKQYEKMLASNQIKDD